MEDWTEVLLDEHYPRFAAYIGSEGPRDEIYKERLKIRDRLQEFLQGEFQSIMAELDDESRYIEVYKLFHLVAQKSYQAGRQHYLSFFGAKRYYNYSGKTEEPSPEIQERFTGSDIKANIRRLYNLLTADRSQIAQRFIEFMEIPFIDINLATGFLMYLDPEEFMMVNAKFYNFLKRLGIEHSRSRSFENYKELQKVCLEIKHYSRKFADGGFKDFLDMDWFEHLFVIGELLEKPLFEGFTKEDLSHFTGMKNDAKYLKKRFKKFKEAITPLLPSILVEKLWIPYINVRATKIYRKTMWVGTSHPEYENPRYGIQFQFYMKKDNFFAGIWGQDNARGARREVAEIIRNNPKHFLELVGKLQDDYALKLWHDNVKKSYLPSEFDEKKLEDFLDYLTRRYMYFSIGPWLTPQEAIEKKDKIVSFSARVVHDLLPMYSFITGKEIEEVKEVEEKKPQALKHVEEVARSHLLAGKNLVIYGPPGTGKTFLAKDIVKEFCHGNSLLRTANAEWTTYDVVGGITFSGKKEGTQDETPFLKLGFKSGFLTQVAEKPSEKLPFWLIIDEINRANLDLSFGKAFTLLDLDHRDDPLIEGGEYPGIPKAIYLPKSFRIIATMNSYDRAILFSLGFAFRRRFAFLELPSPFKLALTKYNLDQEMERNWRSRVDSLIRTEAFESIEREIKKWIIGFSDDERLLFSSFPSFERNLKETFEKVKSRTLDPYNPQIMMYSLAKEITERALVEFGYAQIVDSLKFALVYITLKPTGRADSTNSVVEAVDEAFVAYFVPQFEYILPELRREKISREKDRRIEETLNEVIQILDELGLKQSIAKMRMLKMEQAVF